LRIQPHSANNGPRIRLCLGVSINIVQPLPRYPTYPFSPLATLTPNFEEAPKHPTTYGDQFRYLKAQGQVPCSLRSETEHFRLEDDIALSFLCVSRLSSSFLIVLLIPILPASTEMSFLFSKFCSFLYLRFIGTTF
jgi:hypothetical protein